MYLLQQTSEKNPPMRIYTMCLDFAKAFRKVAHHRLLANLYGYGIYSKPSLYDEGHEYLTYQ